MDLMFWYAVVIVIAMLGAMAFELLATEVIITVALFLFLLAGTITTGEAFAGFSNEGMLTVAFLYIVASAMEATGVFAIITRLMVGDRRGKLRPTLSRLLFPSAAMSAFINNTPLVAMLVPAVKDWCKRFNVPVSKLLLPMNYAIILGSVCTLIGTSTNLVVHGLLLEKGLPGFSFFELGRVGLPVALVGILAIILVLHRLLPKRKEAVEQLGETTREFVVEMKVNQEFPHLGKTVEGSGLRHLQGLFLFQIERGGTIIAPVPPSERITVNDRLFFAGLPATIVQLQKTRGLDTVKDTHFNLKDYDSSDLKVHEIVISPSSPLVGTKVRESNFRGTYNAVILAIHRSGERIQSKVGDVVFHVGDTLLVLAEKEFLGRWYHSREFLLVSELEEVRSKRKLQSSIVVGVVLAMILAATIEVIPMVIASGVAALLLILTRCVSVKEAFGSVDLKVLVSIAGSFGVAKAIENAGVADFMASQIVSLATPHGVIALIGAVYFATVLLTEIVSNNAAAAILFPIALSVAAQLSLPYMPFVYAITLGATTGFATPIGYQTNLMVLGPGGYRFMDFFKMGTILDILAGIVGTISIYLVFFWG